MWLVAGTSSTVASGLAARKRSLVLRTERRHHFGAEHDRRNTKRSMRVVVVEPAVDHRRQRRRIEVHERLAVDHRLWPQLVGERTGAVAGGHHRHDRHILVEPRIPLVQVTERAEQHGEDLGERCGGELIGRRHEHRGILEEHGRDQFRAIHRQLRGQHPAERMTDNHGRLADDALEEGDHVSGPVGEVVAAWSVVGPAVAANVECGDAMVRRQVGGEHRPRRGGGRETVQQHDGRAVRRTGLVVAQRESVMVDRRHGGRLPSAPR